MKVRPVTSLIFSKARTMERFLLRVLDLFSWVFKSVRVDYDQLRAIVATKLTMDNRRQLVAYSRKGQKEPTSRFGLTLFFYAIFGGFVSLAMYNIPSFILSMVVFFTYIMVMVSMTLITDFSSILLDPSDNTIILPRPVDSRTLLAARVTHILLYLGQLAAGLSVIPSIVVIVQYGVGLFFCFWIAVCLSILTALIVTNALYLLIMQFASEEKLRSIINYFQIIMAIVIMAGYQILPRMIERIDVKAFVFKIEWWAYLLPPVWMAASLEAVALNLYDGPHLVLITFAFMLPVAGIFLVNKYLSPAFNRRVATLGGGREEAETERLEKSNFLNKLSLWFTKTPEERAAFDVIYRTLGRDRKIKLKIYPSFGYIVVFGLIFMMRSQEDLATTWANLPGTQYHLMLLYLTFMVLQVALYEIPYSDDFKGSWIYYSAPLTSPGEILSGMLKAICVRLFFPGYIIISTFVLAVWGYRVIDDVVIALFNNFLMLMILAMVNKRHLPLSMAPDVRAQSGNLMRSILTFLLIGALGMSHFLLTLLTKGVIFLALIIPAQVIALFFLFRAYRKTSWSQITL
jgi:ABC-2 type transport system permease protein